MSKIRAFFAVETSEDTKNKILEVQELLKETNSNIKWEPKYKFHITLKFLGDIDELTLKDLAETVKLEVRNFGTLKLEYSLLGGFPNLKFPRVIWIGGIDKDHPIFKLNETIERIADTYNYPKDNRFHPHITLGRVKDNYGLREIIDKIKEIKLGSIIGIANEIVVMKSTLLKSGSIYTIIDKISLIK